VILSEFREGRSPQFNQCRRSCNRLDPLGLRVWGGEGGGLGVAVQVDRVGAGTLRAGRVGGADGSRIGWVLLGASDLGGSLCCRNRGQVPGVSQPQARDDLRITVRWMQCLPDFDGDRARPEY
jgi:hypothetical protein